MAKIGALPFEVVPFTNASGSPSWRVSGSWKGERIRKNFAHRGDALTFAQAKNAEAAQVVGPQLRLTQTRLTDIEVAAAEQGVLRADGRWSLSAVIEAGISALSRTGGAKSGTHLATYFREWLDLVAPEVGDRWLADLRKAGNAYLAAHPRAKVGDFTRAAVREYLDASDWAQQTKANHRNALHRFAAWLVERGHIEANPVAGLRIARRQENDAPPSVLSATQAEAWLRACEMPDNRVLLGWAALCTFAGLRPASEAPRLAWSEIDLAAGTINVLGRKRGQKPRAFALQPNAVAWLRIVQQSGAATPGYFSRRAFRRALDDANAKLPVGGRIEWDEDLQRHSYASYRLAVERDILAVAAEMGNSPRVIYSHYKHPRKAEEAGRFWAIRPTAQLAMAL